MLACHLQLKVTSKTECPFMMYSFFLKITHLPLLSTVNLPLVEFLHILTAFYHLPISLVLFTHSLTGASEYAQVGLNYPLNYTLNLKEIFWKNCYRENFIDECFKMFTDNIQVVKETALTVEKKPLVLVLPCLGSISLRTRTMLKKSP